MKTTEVLSELKRRFPNEPESHKQWKKCYRLSKMCITNIPNSIVTT